MTWALQEVVVMPKGSKNAYTDKQKRRVRHIEQGYEQRGAPVQGAKRIAWSTENKLSGGGQKAKSKH
jgi:hypothetical protein